VPVPSDADSPSSPPALAFRRDGEVGILELTREAKRNALDTATILGLQTFFGAPPEGVRAVVLCAAGDHFCSGLDLNEVTARNTTAGIASSMLWHRAFEAIEFGSVPVVAALQGAVVGGGLELAAACHVRVADASAYYALPEGQRGIFVGGGGSVRLPRLIGTARVMDMILTGRSYDAREGCAMGLSQYVVDAGTARSKALQLAHRIAANAPLSNFAVIQALPRSGEAPRQIGYFTEALISAIASADPEAQTRAADFLAKRAAKAEP
jgi:enoyl-CoA hydratase/carnithine racemase